MKQFIVLTLLTAILSLNIFGQNDSAAAPRQMPADFKSDGCSLFPDGKYRDCCVAHDTDYYFGGSCKARLKSDNRLFKCVAAKKGVYPKLIAPFMWLGVRVFGVSFLPTPFRWGFGKNKSAKTKEEAKPKKDLKIKKAAEP